MNQLEVLGNVRYKTFVLLDTSKFPLHKQCHVVLLKVTNIYEVHNASIIMEMMEAVCTSETSVYFNETKQHYNLKSYKLRK
jgi:hypothetical protein